MVCGYRKGLRRSHPAGQLDEIPEGGGHVGTGLDQSGEMHLRPAVTNKNNKIQHNRPSTVGRWEGEWKGGRIAVGVKSRYMKKTGTGPCKTNYSTSI